MVYMRMIKKEKEFTKATFDDVCDTILKSLEIGADSNEMLQAYMDKETALVNMKALVINFVAKVFVPKRLARSWLETANIFTVIDFLELLGFDTKEFNLDSSSRDNLIAFGFLLWRSDLFDSLYSNYLPNEKENLPPYTSPKIKISETKDFVQNYTPKTQQEYIKAIQRKSINILSKIHVLADLECDCEAYSAEIRKNDPDSSLFDLNLKASPKTLQNYIQALKEANQKSGSTRKIAKKELNFYNSLYRALCLKYRKEPTAAEIIVCDFPKKTESPASLYNKNTVKISDKIAEIEKEIATCEARLPAEPIEISPKHAKIINKRVSDLFDHLQALDGYPVESTIEKTTNIIPDLKLSEFGHKEFVGISEHFGNLSESLKAETIDRIDQEISRLAQKHKLKVAGIQTTKETKESIWSNEDYEEDY